jgi:hypothetical protein
MMRTRIGVVFLAPLVAIGCGGSHTGLPSSPGDAGASSAGAVGGDGAASSSGSGGGGGTRFVPGAEQDAASTCVGLGCDVVPNCTTTLSGTVYDPAGANPLYNVSVFVPEDPGGALPPIAPGASTCSACDASIDHYVTATTSGPDGKFTLEGVPATTNVPLVVQIGKWRREVFLPEVHACESNVLTGSSQTRLPAKRSEGDIPQMALVTGGVDNLGCFLEGVGLDPGEYSAPHAGGRLDIYQGLGRNGAPGLSTGATPGDCSSDNPSCVWNSKANLEGYDIVLLACEGDTYDPVDSAFSQTNKTPTSKQALHDWLDEGGKVFATHYQYTWFKNSPAAEFRNIATWLGPSNGEDNALYAIDTTFPKGMVFAQWLGTVGDLTGSQIPLQNVAESVGAVSTSAQRWIYNPAMDPQSGQSNDTKYLSLPTPVGGIPVGPDAGPPQYCGKAIFTDLHAGGGPTGNIPAACAGPPLNPQLAALEFLFFDLSACVSNDTLPPPSLQ